jgi:hypothetical protein
MDFQGLPPRDILWPLDKVWPLYKVWISGHCVPLPHPVPNKVPIEADFAHGPKFSEPDDADETTAVELTCGGLGIAGKLFCDAAAYS